MAGIPLVSEYMTTELVTLTPELEINHAMGVLLDNDISGAPVVDETGAMVGILTQKDCLNAAIEASYYRDWGGIVSKYMSRDVETLPAGMDMLAAASAFLRSRYRRFPVIENGRLVGQISRADALRALRDSWP
ncbi:CBS domain-containing protein [Pontivivens ytuae]|uniref:CBS domain-containing protein n=1 Tax=Pontivivens ytuae TaxID=2789856 RepID=A0A7S9LTH2_9RHOB|nr:CBS domain-containing protein [Pontivivens ytuae]QPH54957.1 CBS domain-containing protein [Pontivivens ytuae]